jgi:hypothetical protein
MITTWSAQSSVLKRRGRPDQIPGFYEFAAGTLKPLGYADSGTRNVGPRIDQAQLTVHNGDITLSPGMNISGLDIYGQVTGRGGTVTDCIIRGHDKPASQEAMAVGQSYDFGGAVFTWCRFDGTGRESSFMDCINGGNYTARYCEFTRGVDGIGANAVGNATIECCRIFNGYYTAWWDDSAGAKRTASYTDTLGVVHNPPFPAQASGDVHTDGVQIQGQSGWVLRGNYIGGVRGSSALNVQLDPTVSADQAIITALDNGGDFVNSSLIINAIAATPVGAVVELNWLHGGNARLNMSTVSGDTLTGVTVRDNRFIRSTWAGGGGYYIYAAANYQATLSNNVYDDTGMPVPIVTY